MKPIRRIGLSFIMVCAASAIAAASASARSFEFRAETYPVEVRGVSSSSPRFEFGPAALAACRKATFDTNEEGAPNPTQESTTLEVHPIYTECRGTLAAGSFPVAVRTAGCNYVLTAIRPGDKNGPLAIKCSAGKQIELESLGLSACVITIGSQTLNGIEYVNEAGPPKNVKVNAEVEKIKYKASPGCGLGIVEGENGAYRASAVFNGFKPATTEADGLEVHPSHP